MGGVENLHNFLKKARGNISIINTPKTITWKLFGEKTFEEDLNDMYFLIQEVTMPPLQLQAGTQAQTPLHSLNTNTIMFSGGNTVQLEILDTRDAVIEHIFIPWMNSIRNNSYYVDNYAYTTADVTITFKEKNITYMLFGARPTSVDLISPTQKTTGGVSRRVTLTVDFIWAMQNDDNSTADETSKQDQALPPLTKEQMEMMFPPLSNIESAKLDYEPLADTFGTGILGNWKDTASQTVDQVENLNLGPASSKTPEEGEAALREELPSPDRERVSALQDTPTTFFNQDDIDGIPSPGTRISESTDEGGETDTPPPTIKQTPTPTDTGPEDDSASYDNPSEQNLGADREYNGDEYGDGPVGEWNGQYMRRH